MAIRGLSGLRGSLTGLQVWFWLAFGSIGVWSEILPCFVLWRCWVMCSPLQNSSWVSPLFWFPSTCFLNELCRAAGFAELQVRHKVRDNGDKGVPVLLSRTPSCWAGSWAKRRLWRLLMPPPNTAGSVSHRVPPVLWGLGIALIIHL